jgi:hypothetical protein
MSSIVDLDSVILRLAPNVYGPGDRTSLIRLFMLVAILHRKTGVKMELPYSRKHLISCVHVDDVVRAIWFLLQHIHAETTTVTTNSESVQPGVNSNIVAEKIVSSSSSSSTDVDGKVADVRQSRSDNNNDDALSTTSSVLSRTTAQTLSENNSVTPETTEVLLSAQNSSTPVHSESVYTPIYNLVDDSRVEKDLPEILEKVFNCKVRVLSSVKMAMMDAMGRIWLSATLNGMFCDDWTALHKSYAFFPGSFLPFPICLGYFVFIVSFTRYNMELKLPIYFDPSILEKLYDSNMTISGT